MTRETSLLPGWFVFFFACSTMDCSMYLLACRGGPLAPTPPPNTRKYMDNGENYWTSQGQMGASPRLFEIYSPRRRLDRWGNFASKGFFGHPVLLPYKIQLLQMKKNPIYCLGIFHRGTFLAALKLPSF